MAKNFFQDMIKMKSDMRKEISDTASPNIPSAPLVRQAPKHSPKIIVVENKEEKKIEKKVEEQAWPPTVINKVSRRVDLSSEESRKKPRYSIWLVAGVAIIFLFFAVSFLLAQATITINPKFKDITLNQNFTGTKDVATGSGVSFDLISLSGEESQTIEGGEVKDVSIKATGTVVIYNNYSSATQRLDIDTRLEGSNGKLYKTQKAVVVPGLKGKTPGSVEVGIYATGAGPDYNSSPIDFQIFGFKGTPKYSKFYARSKGDITGGFIGKQSVVTDSKKATVFNDMRATLEAKLLRKATDLIPPGFILFQGASVLNVDSQNFDAAGSGDQVPVTLKGTLIGFLLDEKELTKKIVSTSMPDYDGSDVFISNIKDLTFSLLSKDSATNDINNISFNLSGNPKVVYKLDEAKLLGEVAGKSKKEFYQTLAQYPNVISADVLLRPFWKRSFPSKQSDIKIVINYPTSPHAVDIAP
ncbi:MAG: hypothetical protein V4486_01045 [Patescibacteria group bacterium]